MQAEVARPKVGVDIKKNNAAARTAEATCEAAMPPIARQTESVQQTALERATPKKQK